MVVAVGTLIGVMSMQVSDSPTFLRRTQRAWFLLPDAAGLIKNSAVRSAGISVGSIKDIRLQDGKARVDIVVRSDVPLTTSAAVEIKSNGILGDKYVEIYPGSPTDPPLPDDSQILSIKNKGSLDSVIGQIGEITDSLKDVAAILRESVSDDGTRKHVLGRILKNVETLTGDLADMTTANKDKVNDIIDRVADISETLDELINDQSDKGLKKTWKRTMERIDSTMKNIDEIAGKVNRGEGTIGKLINDETTVEELNTAIQGVNGFLDTASRIQMGIDFHGDYLAEVGATKSYIGVRIVPGLDRFYEIGIIDDPAGVVSKEKSQSTVNGGPETTEEVKKTYYNKTKFTILYAKNFWDFTIKGGIIESAGGVGVDYNFFRERIRLSFEAYDFTRTQLRLSARVKLTHGLYLTGGYSDMLDKIGARSGYVGAGLFLTNDDLKLLLSGSFLR